MSTSRLLRCGCMKTYDSVPPAIGDEVLCSRCGETSVMAPTYVVKCVSCTRYVRKFADLMELTALTKAASHAVRKRHTVEVRKNDVLIHTAGANSMQLTTDDIPPF